MARFFALLIGLVVVGPLLVAFGLLPPALAGAWPAYALTFLPLAVGVVVSLAFLGYQPLIAAPLPDSAATWLQRQIHRFGTFGVSVAAMEKGERHRGNFYHPASRTIVLADDVHDEHTARAYAVAAHELGHALFHTDRPVLSAVLLWARRAAGRAFYLGVSLLLGSALVGGDVVRLIAALLIAAAVILHLLVVVDEAVASTLAAQLLRDDLALHDQGRIARGHLRRALATYVAMALAYAAPLAVWRWIVARLGDGLLVPGAPLGGVGATVAAIAAVGCLLGAAGAIFHVVRPQAKLAGALALLAALVALCWTPLFTVLAWDQPAARAHPWTVVMATVPAWSLLAMPAFLVLRALAGLLVRDLESVPLPFEGPTTMRLSRVSVRTLVDREDDAGLLARAWTFAIVLWVVPLALVHLGVF